MQEYKGIAYKLAQEYLPYAGNAVDLDDLLQAGALGAIRADETYSPNKGSWFNWCAFYIRQEMQALCGFRTSKVDAMRGALSMDEPINEDGGTLGELLQADTPTPEEDWDRFAVADAVRASVKRLRADRRWVVELVDLEGKTRAEAASELATTIPTIAATRREAFADLRRDRVILDLAEASGIINGHKNFYNLYSARWAFMEERRNDDGKRDQTNRCGS